jgi:hypothetical protein
VDDADNSGWDQLTQTLPDEQKEQLAQLILSRLAAGWGEIEIEFKYHHIFMFKEGITIPPKRTSENSDTKEGT